MVGKVVNYNNGESVVRALVVREGDDTQVNLWAPNSTGQVELVAGVPRRAPADYAAGGGGGRTYHTLDEAE